MTRHLLIVVLGLLGLTIFPAIAEACSCGRLSWQERLASSDSIFLGRVVDAQPLQYVEMEVGETFKGRVARRVRIPTGQSDCDYFLPPIMAERGMQFLIYASIRDGRVAVSRCLGSGPVDSKSDELARLRQAG